MRAIAVERKRIFRGDRLREIRERRGLTQEDLNKRLGFGAVQVHKYETGKSDPSPDVLIRLVKELEVSSDWLLGLVDSPNETVEESTLSPLEYKLLSAYRRGDLREVMRIASEEPES